MPLREQYHGCLLINAARIDKCDAAFHPLRATFRENRCRGAHSRAGCRCCLALNFPGRRVDDAVKAGHQYRYVRRDNSVPLAKFVARLIGTKFEIVI